MRMRTKIILWTGLAVGLLLLAGGASLLGLAREEPAFFRAEVPTGRAAQRVRAVIDRRIKNAVWSSSTKGAIKLTLTEAEVNACVAANLEPIGIDPPRFRLESGVVRMAARVEGVGVVTARLVPLVEDGLLRFDLEGLRIGALPVPMAATRLSDEAKRRVKEIDEARYRLFNLISVKGRITAFEVDDGTVRLVGESADGG